MIIIKVQGGLGNQMFQYALYERMKRSGKNVKIDITSYNTFNLHNGFELEKVFDLNIDYADELEVFSLIDRSYINELEDNKIYNFQENIFQLDNCYLSGYWQNEKYFREMRDIILSTYKFNVYDEKNIKMLEKIESTQSVSIHIRRGDYLLHPDLNNVATREYYINAINIINEKVENPEFFIFSDDINWVRQNLSIENGTFIDHNSGKDSYKDMFLMSKCKHNIIANSTFSWWGAWLNANENNITIRPQIWMNSAEECDDICSCDAWIKCPNGQGNESVCDKNLDYNSKKDNSRHYIDMEMFELLNNIFYKKKYDVLKKLRNKKHKYIYYFNFRASIIEKDKQKIEENFKKFVNLIDNNIDFNLYISAKFHLAEYMYMCKDYREANKIFFDINELTNSSHNKAKEYIEKISMLLK